MAFPEYHSKANVKRVDNATEYGIFGFIQRGKVSGVWYASGRLNNKNIVCALGVRYFDKHTYGRTGWVMVSHAANAKNSSIFTVVRSSGSQGKSVVGVKFWILAAKSS